MRIAIYGVLGLILAAPGCSFSAGDQAKVAVDCLGGETNIDCTVTHKQGKGRAKACWDLTFDCQNGAKVTGAGCQEVGPGETQHKLIPIGELKNNAACDKVATTTITNLKITAP
jgi:hypothetical protein